MKKICLGGSGQARHLNGVGHDNMRVHRGIAMVDGQHVWMDLVRPGIWMVLARQDEISYLDRSGQARHLEYIGCLQGVGLDKPSIWTPVHGANAGNMKTK